MKDAVGKNQLRALMHKFRFPEQKMQELEAAFHGRDRLPERVLGTMHFWREFCGPRATLSELIRTLRLMQMEALSQRLRAMQVCAQALRL